MDYSNHITNHEKGKHLSYEDDILIELRLKDGWKANAIAQKELHCSPNTVRNIIRKGMTPLYNGKVFRFKAKTAWKAYFIFHSSILLLLFYCFIFVCV